MSRNNTVDILNQVLTLQYRSLPMYLVYGAPWTHHGDEQASAVLKNIVADQERISRRIAEEIYDRNAIPNPDDFPLEYAELNFLSLEYLLGELLADHTHNVAQLELLTTALTEDAPAKALVEEVLGSARAHLDALQGLAKQPTA